MTPVIASVALRTSSAVSPEPSSASSGASSGSGTAAGGAGGSCVSPPGAGAGGASPGRLPADSGGSDPSGPCPSIVNQSDLSPRPVRASSPETSTVLSSPTTCNVSTRPPSAPRPLRSVTVISLSGPTPKASDTCFAVTVVVQSCVGEATSPASSTAGKSPPAVQPPVDAENSVATGAPPFVTTVPAVSATAASVRGSSSDMPPYTWQACVSHVSA